MTIPTKLITLPLLLTLSLLPNILSAQATKENKKVAKNQVEVTALQTGDIIFTSGTGGLQQQAIKAATGSPWTHTGVIMINNGTPMVLEAVQPVQFISLKKYLARGGDSRTHEYKRLIDTSKLSPETTLKANEWAKKHIGKNYDGKYQWSDNTLYCSELVWKVFDVAADIELCKVKTMKDFNLNHPIVAKLIKQRYGSINKLNLTEKIVAPSDIYDSNLLKSITPKK